MVQMVLAITSRLLCFARSSFVEFSTVTFARILFSLAGMQLSPCLPYVMYSCNLLALQLG